MSTCSSILAWKIPRTEETGRLQSMVSQKSRSSAGKDKDFSILDSLPLCILESLLDLRNRSYLPQLCTTQEETPTKPPPTFTVNQFGLLQQCQVA